MLNRAVMLRRLSDLSGSTFTSPGGHKGMITPHGLSSLERNAFVPFNALGGLPGMRDDQLAEVLRDSERWIEHRVDHQRPAPVAKHGDPVVEEVR
jgi:hypothetical protein